MTTYTRFAKEEELNPENWARGENTKDCVFLYSKAISNEIARRGWTPEFVETVLFNEFSSYSYVFHTPRFEELTQEEQNFIYNNCIVDEEEYEDGWIF